MIKAITGSSVDDTHLGEIAAHLESGLDAVENAINAAGDPSLNADVETLDGNRDRTLVKFSGFMRGFRYHLDPQKADSAEFLYEIICRHDHGAKKRGYSEQSSVVNAMLKDFQTEKAQNAAKLCDGEIFIEKLRRDQENFENAIMNRVSSASETDTPRLSELIKPVRTDIDEILMYLGSRERFHPEMYAALVAEINAIIGEVLTAARAIKSRKDNTKETESQTVA